MSWNLPPELYKAQDSSDALCLAHHPINDLSWLRSARIQELDLLVHGSSPKGVEQLKKLKWLSLDDVTRLQGFDHLPELTFFALDLSRSQIKDLSELGQLTNLSTLSIN